jgi:hypothetical protein
LFEKEVNYVKVDRVIFLIPNLISKEGEKFPKENVSVITFYFLFLLIALWHFLGARHETKKKMAKGGWRLESGEQGWGNGGYYGGETEKCAYLVF